MAEQEKQAFLVKDVLREIVKKDKRLNEAVIFALLEKAWQKIADQNLINNAKILRYQNYILTINCRNSSWSQQLMFLKEKIKEAYQKIHPRIIIKDIKFVCQKWTEPEEKENKLRLTIAEKEKVTKILTDFDSLKYKEQLQKIMERDQEYKKNQNFQKCPSCGQEYLGTKNICQKCFDKKNNQTYSEIRDYLNEAPWSRYEDIKVDIKNSEEEIYLLNKENIRKKLYDQIKQLSYEINRDKSPRLKRKLRELCERYTMIKTGVIPAKLTTEIVREAVGKRIFKLIEN